MCADNHEKHMSLAICFCSISHIKKSNINLAVPVFLAKYAQNVASFFGICDIKLFLVEEFSIKIGST